MKNIFTLFFACLMTFSVFGQTQGKYRGETLLQASQADVVRPGNYLPSTTPAMLAPQEQKIGITKYDSQTNGSFGSRFHRFDDGRMVTTWTGGVTNPSAFPDRGSFYNYFDGTSWTIDPNNTVRIENERSGWPSWAPLGEGEVIASHNGTTVNIWTRATLGTGTWTKKSSITGANTWARICVHNGIIHLITSNTNGDGVDLFYSKSTDGGATWNPQHTPLANVFPDYDYNLNCYSSDSYVWAEPVNGIIALSLSGAAGDLVIYKSSDDGQTWQKKVAWYTPEKNQPHEFPQTYAPTSAHSLVIDEYGKCHLAFIGCRSSGGGYSAQGISNAFYWNEDMPIFSNADPYAALDPDENPQYANDGRLVLNMSFIGDDFDMDNMVLYSPFGMIHKINMAVAGPNRIIIALAVQDHETLHASGYYFSRIFACSYIKDADGWRLDQNWANDVAGYPGWLRVNKASHLNENCTHPQIVADKSGADDAKFHIFYMVDDIPGSALEGASNGANNPQYNDFTDNYFVIYSDFINFTGPDETPPTILTASLPNGKVGTAYDQTLVAGGTQPITWSIETGTLPAGLTLNETTGKISGTPTEGNITATFTVKATNAFGNDPKELSIHIDTITVGITALEISPIKVYPNPANDILYIDANQPVQVIFYDFLGREMMNLNITEKANIDISKLPAGIYNIKMQYGSTIENRKIVKR